jgi:tryptophan synthase beta chain
LKPYDFPDAKGHFGPYGGVFAAETLMQAIEELRLSYDKYRNDPDFLAEFEYELKHFVGRPTPVYHARRWSEELGGAQIWFKREDLNHTGAHKINNSLGQALLARRMGKKRIIAETGAGQHGVATATVCALMGMDCTIYMGELDIKRQRPNVERMRILGAKVVPAISGSKTLKDATNEAMRAWIADPVGTHYIIGSVVGPHPYPEMVARFQSVISEEIKWQLKAKEGRENPDLVIACVGGGSNAAGAFYHYYNEPKVRLIAVEAAGHGIHSGKSAATSVLGTPGILHGSKTLLMQTEDGQVVEPHSISAGLDYPGIGPVHAHLHEIGRAEFVGVEDEDAMKAGILLSRTEGIIPAIETAHAIHALNQIEFNANDLIVINLSGRGDKDLETYIHWGNY